MIRALARSSIYAAGSVYLNDVDLFDSVTGHWSTAQLSASNYVVCGASVGVFALFVGFFEGGMSCLLLGVYCIGTPLTITDISTADDSFDIVDVFNSTSGLWSTAQLSAARDYVSAATIATLAIFAGGSTGSKSL